MATPADTDGPSFEPPQLPPGWIAQWDAASRKYYYVQISTGVSQWETPTEAAPGGTPAQPGDHPYGVPGKAEVITHPDGSQTVKHSDGRMEPILPGDGSRGMDGPSGERGFGSMATNLLVNQLGGGKNHGGGSGGGLGGLASSFLSGGHSSGGGGSHGGSSGGIPGKLVGQLASNLFSSGNKPDAPQNYHGGASSTPSHSGGLAGAMMGGVAHMFGGQTHGSNQNYGYSNSGQSQGGYTGAAPPTSYQPPGASSSYTTPSSTQHGTPSHSGPSGQQGTPSYAPPPSQGYPQQHSYGSPPPNQPPQGQYGGGNYNQSYGNGPPPPAGQHSYPGPQYGGQQAPPVPTGTHPNQGPPGGYSGQW